MSEKASLIALFRPHCSLRLSHISGSVVSARVVALQWRVSQRIAIASFQQKGSLMMMRRMTRIMLIPNKEASSGFNVGLPRYQRSPVLVLLFPLPASVCVCVCVCVCVSTFQDPQHFSGSSVLHECPSPPFFPLKANSPLVFSEWNACVNGQLRDRQRTLTLLKAFMFTRLFHLSRNSI